MSKGKDDNQQPQKGKHIAEERSLDSIHQLMNQQIFGEINACLTEAKTGENFTLKINITNNMRETMSDEELESFGKNLSQETSPHKNAFIDTVNLLYSPVGEGAKSDFDTIVHISIPYMLYLPNFEAFTISHPEKARFRIFKTWTQKAKGSTEHDPVGETNVLYYRGFDFRTPKIPVNPFEGFFPNYTGKNIEFYGDETGYFRYTTIILEINTGITIEKLAEGEVTQEFLQEVSVKASEALRYILTVYRNTASRFYIEPLSQIFIHDVFFPKLKKGVYTLGLHMLNGIGDAIINESSETIRDLEARFNDGFIVPVHTELFDNAKAAFFRKNYKIALLEPFQALDVYVERLLEDGWKGLGLNDEEIEEKMKSKSSKRALNACLQEVKGKPLAGYDSQLYEEWLYLYDNVRHRVVHGDHYPDREEAERSIELNEKVLRKVQEIANL